MIMMAHKPQSLESVLDEERRHVLALLEEARNGSSSDSTRSETGTHLPLQPVRSMLQFDLPLPSSGISATSKSVGEPTSLVKPVRSMLDINSIISPIKNTSSLSDINDSKFYTNTYRSMLDISSTGTSPSLSFDVGNGQNTSALRVRSMLDVSPTRQNYLTSSTPHRSSSPRSTSSRNTLDFSPTAMFSLPSSEKNFKPQINRPSLTQRASSSMVPRHNHYPWAINSTVPNMEPESTNYLSRYLPSDTSGPFSPKRSIQTCKKPSMPSVMIDMVKSDLFCPRDSDKHGSSQKSKTRKSRSPHSRFRMRSKASKNSESTYTLINDDRVITPKRLQRRRSDANLTRSPGTVLSLPRVRRRTFNGTSALRRESRPGKETANSDGENAVILSSDDSDSDEEEVLRGRTLENRPSNQGDKISDSSGCEKDLNNVSNSHTITSKESQETAKKLQPEKNDDELPIAPEVIITKPPNTLLTTKSSNDLLKTSSDDCDSRSNTSYDSEIEASISDIKRAQKLPINITACISTPATNRCVRSIYRGDFAKIQQEVLDKRRARKYLVAIDLSEEAAHALEWTIGTVLRDGDTLLAIYCMNEEVIISTYDNGLDEKFQENVTGNLNSDNKPIPSPTLLDSIRPQNHQPPESRAGSTSESFDSNTDRSKGEQQRRQAVQEITDKVSKFLRRTKLQVKVVIEVIHCKSPKHLITEVIDFVSPTLVILGSRGRSALKGFILGSFSNYIVTKSSAPVMVARKRLRNSNKYKRPSIRLANNIENPHPLVDSRTLTAARID